MTDKLASLSDEELMESDSLDSILSEEPPEEAQNAPESSEEAQEGNHPTEAPEEHTEPFNGSEGQEEVKQSPDFNLDPEEELVSPGSQESETNYREFYERVMQPFKANGKMIELRSPDEAITLMQQGANYTRKMQEIAPYRKILMMLQQNDLLDEGKIDFLISLDKKDTAAIQKYFKDKDMDPLDLSVSDPVEYKSGQNIVSDQDYNFQTTIEDLLNKPHGTETYKVLDTWDSQSIQMLQTNPIYIEGIRRQLMSGTYNLVNNEIQHRIATGQLQLDVPYFTQYLEVGEQMLQDGKLVLVGDDIYPANKTQSGGNSKAKAAGITRGVPSRSQPTLDLLNLSDEDFLEQFKGRV